MLQCSATKDDARCQRRLRLIVPKGAVRDPNPSFTCEGCKSGKAPFVARTSERKGQQKQAAKKKK